jgi:hypothetical protein
MTKTIDTLVNDIYRVLEEGTTNVNYEEYGREHAKILLSRLEPNTGERSPTLRLSSIGSPCPRKLWYGIHTPTEREPLIPHTRLKFLYGDLIETLVLELAKEAGHLVQGEQDEILVNGVLGHRDCVIDGMLVDVKSASPYSFVKFEGGLRSEDDSFGYLTQLGSYLLGSQDDPLVVEKNKAGFLVINKVTGKLCLDVHEFTEEDFVRISDTINERKLTCVLSHPTPARAFEAIPEGKSGNEKLGVNCSYCDYKAKCWPELRTFMYAGNRPVFLTKVEREPNVPEVTGE